MSVSSPGGLYGSSAGSTGDNGWVSSMGPAYSATEELIEQQIRLQLEHGHLVVICQNH